MGEEGNDPMSATTVTATPHRSTFRDATRVLSSPLAALEKRTLIWLAHRMPSRINSDHLTGLALLAMLCAGLSYWLASASPIGLVLAVVLLAVNWFGDSLDGTLARVRNRQRPRYGYYVDHVVDALGSLFLFGGLALSGYMSPVIAFGLLILYLMMMVEIALAAHSIGIFKITHFGMGPTELRILLAIGNLVLLVHPNAVIFGHTFRLFDVGGAVGIAGLFITFIVSATRNTGTLYRAEPIPAAK
jgi:phosphatidylglycerophosphate synthase